MADGQITASAPLTPLYVCQLEDTAVRQVSVSRSFHRNTLCPYLGWLFVSLFCFGDQEVTNPKETTLVRMLTVSVSI